MRIFIMLICAVIAVQAQNLTKDRNNSEIKAERQRPYFPRAVKRFVVTENPLAANTSKTARVPRFTLSKKSFSETTRVESTTPTVRRNKFTFKPRMPLKVNSEETTKRTYVTVTRKPLMKAKIFTIQPSAESWREPDRRTKAKLNFKSAKYNKKLSTTTTTGMPVESEDSESNDSLELTTAVVNSEEIKKPISTPSPERESVKSDEDMSLEEKEDRKVFMFLDDKDVAAKKEKRDINIIEEENMATTISGYQYTWRNTRLHSDLTYRNINA